MKWNAFASGHGEHWTFVVRSKPYTASVRRYSCERTGSTRYHWCVDHVARNGGERVVWMIESGVESTAIQAKNRCQEVQRRLVAGLVSQPQAVSKFSLSPNASRQRRINHGVGE